MNVDEIGAGGPKTNQLRNDFTYVIKNSSGVSVAVCLRQSCDTFPLL